MLTEQLVERGFFGLTEIRLDEQRGGPTGVAPVVQVLRTGKFDHPKYGPFEITTKILSELKKNFDAKIRGVELAVDYFHESDQKAAGWFTELFLNEAGTELWARVNWTPTALRMLSEKEIRYFSPDFAFSWKDPESGKTYRNVLFGGGLTNRPFVKEMAAIQAAEKGKKKMDEETKKLIEGLIASVKRLEEKSDAQAKKLAEYADKPAPVQPDAPTDGADDAGEDDLPTLKKKLADALAMNEKLMAEKKKSDEAKTLAEKETEFTVMLSEGKVCAAQKDAFMKGDMKEFAAKAAKVNLSEGGHGGDGGNKGSGDKEDRILKLAEEKVKANPKLALVDAISLAQREIKE